MRRRIPLPLPLLAGLLLAAPALAATHYKSKTTTEAGSRSQTMVAEAWIDGSKARIELQQSDNPVMGEGTYLLTQDAGKTLVLVNPKDKTYAKWDIDSMLQMVGGMLNAMGGMVKIEISDPKVEKLLEEPGGALLGIPTTHVRYHTTYVTSVRILAMKNESATDSTQDIWLAPALTEAAFGVWLRSSPPKTGNEMLDKLAASERSKLQGVPLKNVTVTKTVDKKRGRETVTTSETEVTELDRNASAPAGGFDVPAGYKETEMTPQGEDQKGQNPFMNLFKHDQPKKDGGGG